MGGLLTVDVGHRRIVLVFDKQIAEFDLGGVHVLACDHRFWHPTTRSLTVGDDVAHLR